MKLKIVSAKYGGKDVKDIIESKIENDSINITVGNLLFGDPIPFIEKYLNITYELNGTKHTNVIAEENQFKIDSHVEFIPISCKCITYGRVNFLEEALECASHPGDFMTRTINLVDFLRHTEEHRDEQS